MTTRQELRPDPRIRARARRAITLPIAALAALTMTATATPAPAEAAPPAVARTWTALMYQSLTRQQVAATLRTTIAARRATVVTRNAEVATATTASTLAQARLTTATAADTKARARQTVAQTGLTNARTAVAKALAKKPRNNATIAAARTAVGAATRALTVRTAEAKQFATALAAARTTARTTAEALTTATAARDAATVAVGVTQRKLVTLPTASALAGQASAVSRDMVTQVRTGFAITDTAQVNGITVHRNVAYALKRMLDDAQAGGIVLSAGGFRTKKRQIELRTINGCPDVWTAPSSSCRVPTAIPGRSLHEIGMAVDITSGGRTLTRNSPGFKWLSLNAKAYGFVNLPSEAWHWSVTGG